MNIKDLFFGIDFEQKGNEVDIKSIQTKASEEVVDGLFFLAFLIFCGFAFLANPLNWLINLMLRTS